MDPSFLLYGFYVAVFMSAALFAYGIWRFYDARRMGMSTLRRRLRDGSPSQAVPPRPENLRRDSGARTALPRRVVQALDQAGLPYSVKSVLWSIAGLTVVAILIVFLAGSWFLPGLAFVGGIGLAVAYSRHRKARRLARFAAQLPDALDVMVPRICNGIDIPPETFDPERPLG